VSLYADTAHGMATAATNVAPPAAVTCSTAVPAAPLTHTYAPPPLPAVGAGYTVVVAFRVGGPPSTLAGSVYRQGAMVQPDDGAPLHVKPASVVAFITATTPVATDPTTV